MDELHQVEMGCRHDGNIVNIDILHRTGHIRLVELYENVNGTVMMDIFHELTINVL